MSEKEQQPPVRDRVAWDREEARLQTRMSGVRNKLLVLSGKGGVGKSTVAAQIAVSLSRMGKRVGLLDVDVHGPSIPQIVGLPEGSVHMIGEELLPVSLGPGLAVMSMGFLLKSREDAVIWRGPKKYGLIRQFLKDVHWGELDALVVDSPPGTGDEPLAVAQMVGRPAGAVVVTTPQSLAVNDVRRCIHFCGTVNLPVVGVVENMSGLDCPRCGERIELFGSGGGEVLALEMGVPFLGRIPIDPGIVRAGETGVAFVGGAENSPSGRAIEEIVRAVVAWCEAPPRDGERAAAEKNP